MTAEPAKKHHIMRVKIFEAERFQRRRRRKKEREVSRSEEAVRKEGEDGGRHNFTYPNQQRTTSEVR